MADDVDDGELVVDLVRSFAQFYGESRPATVRLAFLLTGGSAVAEELVQEAYIRVHARWDSIRQPDAYLRRIVVNEVASHHRRQRVEASKLRLLAPGVAVQPVDELRDAIAMLPPRQRTAVVLRYYADLPDAEIAAAMRCRVPAVKSLLHRALNELRKVIER